MKKYLPHILFALVMAGAIYMLLTGEKKSGKVLNKRLSFRVNEKLPYGFWVAYNNLSHLFPVATISTSNKEPGFWDSLSLYGEHQALIIMTPYFYPDENELEKLVSFAKNGNDVFISSMVMGPMAQTAFGVSTNFGNSVFNIMQHDGEDSMRVALQTDSLGERTYYEYPGTRKGSYFSTTDLSRAYRLGYDDFNHANFIRLRTGKGNIYVHTVPLVFSNYFLLYKNNIRYFETALSYIQKDVKQVVWDEYFLYKRYENEDSQPDERENKGFMNVLFSFKSLKWAFLSLIFLLLLFVLMEMRRKQRYIPEMKKPVNDSMEFVKTIGRLYFEKGDHRNLCRKMGTYFLEYIRNRYNLSTANLDEAFIKNLQFKSGYPENELRTIIRFIRNLENITVSDSELKEFYRGLEDFYAKC